MDGQADVGDLVGEFHAQGVIEQGGTNGVTGADIPAFAGGVGADDFGAIAVASHGGGVGFGVGQHMAFGVGADDGDAKAQPLSQILNMRLEGGMVLGFHFVLKKLGGDDGGAAQQRASLFDMGVVQPQSAKRADHQRDGTDDQHVGHEKSAKKQALKHDAKVPSF